MDDIRGGNLPVNGALEGGNYGWSFPGAAPTPWRATSVSEFADGLMGKFQWSAGGKRYIQQDVVVPADLAGREMTLRATVELTDAGFLFPPVSGG